MKVIRLSIIYLINILYVLIMPYITKGNLNTLLSFAPYISLLFFGIKTLNLIGNIKKNKIKLLFLIGINIVFTFFVTYFAVYLFENKKIYIFLVLLLLISILIQIYLFDKISKFYFLKIDIEAIDKNELTNYLFYKNFDNLKYEVICDKFISVFILFLVIILIPFLIIVSKRWSIAYLFILAFLFIILIKVNYNMYIKIQIKIIRFIIDMVLILCCVFFYNYYAAYIFITTNTIHLLIIIFSTLFIVPYLSTLMNNQGENK